MTKRVSPGTSASPTPVPGTPALIRRGAAALVTATAGVLAACGGGTPAPVPPQEPPQIVPPQAPPMDEPVPPPGAPEEATPQQAPAGPATPQ